jgi:hypothetical protein
MVARTREIGSVIIIDLEGEFRRSEDNEPSLPELVKCYLDEGKRKILINLERL